MRIDGHGFRRSSETMISYRMGLDINQEVFDRIEGGNVVNILGDDAEQGHAQALLSGIDDAGLCASLEPMEGYSEHSPQLVVRTADGEIASPERIREIVVRIFGADHLRYYTTDIWGDGEFDSFEELEQCVEAVCRENPLDFEFPEDGLRLNRDYVVD